MTAINRCVVLAARPSDLPGLDNFALIESPAPRPLAGQFVLRILYVSVDPAMRGWIRADKNYSEPVAVGAVMRSFALGEVTESHHPGFRPGELVYGWFGWQEWAVSDGREALRKVDPLRAPPTAALGVLGVNGLTAWVGMRDIGQPKGGETVVVSTAAGAVGSVAGQMARIAGARVVGITGSDEKAALCREAFGFDAAINYKSCGDMAAVLRAACPEGVDVYFDNVGGATLDAVLGMLKTGARIAICGTIGMTGPSGPRVERALLIARARMQGFLVLDHFHRFEEAAAELSAWIAAGRLRYREQIVDGIENAPQALLDVLAGRNLGRMIVRVAAEAR